MEKRGFNIFNNVLKVIFFIAFIILLAIGIYSTFFYKYECQSYECFQKAMQDCDKARYTNEEPEASWQYSILNERDNSCVIRVKLLQAKEGELGIDKLNGYSMECYYPPGSSAYPEKDLSKCHGRLKEEIQTIIIKKLHTHILENLKEVNESLNSFT